MNFIKRKFSANLLFTDTYSLVYEIKTYDIYDDVYQRLSTRFKFFDLVYKKVIAKMKDGFKGKIISEFVGLKSKMFSFIAIDGGEIKRANKIVVKNIRHE